MEEIDTHRIKKVDSLIQEEVAQIILEEIDLPKNVLVTVILVNTSADIKHAKVFISILPKNKTGSTFKFLNRKIRVIQKSLNKKLVMKFVPRLKFYLDETQDKIHRIEELIEKNRK